MLNIARLKSLNRKIIIAGRSASGKSHLKDILIKNGFNAEVGYSTRQIRPNEVNGADLQFISRDKFISMINNCEFIEYAEYDGNYYGTTIFDFRDKNLFIMTPSGIEELKPDTLRECYVILVECSESERILRMIDRGWSSDKIQARLKADESEFADFKKYDMIYRTDK